MWIRYSAIVAFFTLLIAYAATLMVGWSFAQAVPWTDAAGQLSLLTSSAAIAIVSWPTWFIHWRWAKRDWLWESTGAQKYLLFFTLLGLGASGVISVQVITRLLDIAVGTKTLATSQSFLTGGIWSVAFSLWLWIYHGRTWLTHRRRGSDAPSQSRWNV
ncbi:MAG: hypothetical protein U0401_30415 [Anaerolineae bacterium]